MVPPRSQDTAQGKAQTRAQDKIAAIHNSARTRSRRIAAVPDNDRDVYRSLISEATVPEEDRPLKKPRAGRPRQKQPSDTTLHNSAKSSDQPSARGEDASGIQNVQEETPSRPQQTIVDSDESDEEDIDWEDVGLNNVEANPTPPRKDDEFGDVSLEIITKKIQKRAAIAKRKPVTTAEKLLRLEAHEAHLLFLLFHVHVRNAWCNMPEVQNNLKTLLLPEIVSLLNPDQSLIQFGRSEQFLTGLQKAVFFFRAKFNVTASGIRQPNWAEDTEGIKEQIRSIQEEMPPVERSDFIKSAASLSGSQDVGAQLFCALLRCVGVETRLVCSLQPLPFGTSAPKSVTPQRTKNTVHAESERENTSAGETSAGSASEGSSSSRRRIIAPGRIRRLAKPNLDAGSSRPTTPARKKKRPVRTLDYPVYWVEAFNEAYQKWVPVDAVVTGTVARPSKLEPPASYEANTMTYVVGFEDNGIARDVTRRYTKAYNAKTRKLRVEVTSRGEEWWRKALKVFRRASPLDRDQVEDAELAKKDASEGLPSNVLDFKDHPYYALERHLKRHEVIWPLRASGKVTVGKGAVESVYRRSDVQTVRSADKWYRFGREIKPNEQPLKHVPSRNPRGRDADLDDTEMEEAPATGLYAFSQTSLYVPPPVKNGRIPKNIYGNLDIYVPSMVPSGGHHVPHSLAKKAAQILNIDYADAVTGFQFKGRHGTAITSGVVVAEEYHEAVEAVIEGFKHVQENEEARLYSLECLKLWRRFLAGLRIKMRLSEYTTTGPKDIEPATVKAKMDEAEDAQDEIVEAGGFFPDQGEITAPTAHQFKRRRSAESEHEDGDIAESAPRLRRQRKTIVESDQESDEQSEEEYILPSPQKPPTRRRRLMLSESPPAVEDGLEDMENAGGFLPDADADADNLGGGFVPDADADGFGGGFMPENNDAEATHESGGGFMPEPDNEENTYESDGGFVPEEDDPALNSGGGFMPARDDQPEDTDGGFLPTCNTLGTQSPVQQAPEDINMDRETETINRNLEEEKQLDDTFDPDNMDDDTFDPDEMDTGISNKVLARESSTGAHMQKKDDADDDDGDRGSLLSHDPDDEDAEPEWLYSD